jgi:hypothetical protein
MTTNKPKFVCQLCDFKSSKSSDWVRHVATLKHQNGDKITPRYSCDCGKAYKYRQGLHRHSIHCSASSVVNGNLFTASVARGDLSDTSLQPQSQDQVQELTHLVVELVRSNGELQKQMAELLLKGSLNPSSVVLNNNSHNKTFNLQVFLNEDCKDAMNLTEFVDSITLQLSDLETVGHLGYVEGLSSIIIRKLNELDIYKRPIHCTDAKRDVVHIKDNDKWQRDQGHLKLCQAIKRISKKNSDLLLDWKDSHPGAQYADNRFNDQFLQLIQQSMGGTADIAVSEHKIIKRITKQIVI